VLRGNTAASLTQLGGDRPAAATLIDAPGAGTYHYAVVAFHQGWTSQPSTVVKREDPNYVLTGAAPTNGTSGCATAASIGGMQQGHQTSGAGVSPLLASTTYALCTDTWTAGQTLPAGTTTVTAYTSNTHGTQSCAVALAVRVGSTTLGTASEAVPSGTTATSPLVWSVQTLAHSFTAGQRLTVTLTPGGGGGCNNSRIHAAGTTSPSKVTLTA
jgi:hypothetical protein